jgi:hypothetical protein
LALSETATTPLLLAKVIAVKITKAFQTFGFSGGMKILRVSGHTKRQIIESVTKL